MLLKRSLRRTAHSSVTTVSSLPVFIIKFNNNKYGFFMEPDISYFDVLWQKSWIEFVRVICQVSQMV